MQSDNDVQAAIDAGNRRFVDAPILTMAARPLWRSLPRNSAKMSMPVSCGIRQVVSRPR